MSTYREVTYMVLDLLKSRSDDSNFKPEHIKFMLDKNRALLLKQKYEKNPFKIPSSSYQTLCLDVELKSEDCSDYTELVSTQKIPDFMNIGSVIITVGDNDKTVSYVSRERFPYSGTSKYSSGIYATLSDDNKIRLKSNDSALKYIEKVKVRAVFEDSDKAKELVCEKDSDGNSVCGLDSSFPLEDSLITVLIQSVVQLLSPLISSPEDTSNNGADDLPIELSYRDMMRRQRQAANTQKNNNTTTDGI